MLPWNHYLPLLQRFLDRLSRDLTSQKILVRIAVNLLNAFHFDLELSAPVSEATSSNKSSNKEAVSENTSSNKTPVGKKEEGKGVKFLKKKKGKKDEEEMAQEEVEEDGNEADAEEEDDAVDDEETEEAEMETDANDVTTTAQGWIKCNVAQATKIHTAILKQVLPRLYSLLTAKAQSEDFHKKAKRSKAVEDNEILRVPIALAMVKLLQSLPLQTLNSKLPR